MQHHAHVEQSVKLGMGPLFWTVFTGKVEHTLTIQPRILHTALAAVCYSAGYVCIFLGSSVPY